MCPPSKSALMKSAQILRNTEQNGRGSGSREVKWIKYRALDICEIFCVSLFGFLSKPKTKRQSEFFDLKKENGAKLA